MSDSSSSPSPSSVAGDSSNSLTLLPKSKVQDENHPLYKWLSKKDFATVKPFVRWHTKKKNADLSHLLQEHHVVVTLNMEVIFDDGENENEEDDDDIRELKLQRYSLCFEGKTTQQSIMLEVRESDYYIHNLIQARDILLGRLANLCTSIKRLTIQSSLDGLPSPQYRNYYDIQDDYERWADCGLVLNCFAKAAFWTITLDQLEILGDLELPSCSSIENDESILVTKPQNLRLLRLSCNDFDLEENADHKAKSFIEAFPTLRVLKMKCHRGRYQHNFYLPTFFQGLVLSNPNLETIHIEGDENTVNLGGRKFILIVYQLLRLDELEHVTLDLKGRQKHDRYYADALVAYLKFTGIRELSLHGLSASSRCFDYLIKYLSEGDDCHLRFFDLETENLKKEQLSDLLRLLSLKETNLLPTNNNPPPDLKTLDALLILRRFQEVIPSKYNQTAKFWPFLLANAGKWKQHMKGLGKTAASRWFFSRYQLAPTLMYSLIRERVDIISDHLARKKDGGNNSVAVAAKQKRPHEEKEGSTSSHDGAAKNAKRVKVEPSFVTAV